METQISGVLWRKVEKMWQDISICQSQEVRAEFPVIQCYFKICKKKSVCHNDQSASGWTQFSGGFVSLKGVSSLYVDHQEVTGFVGEQVTITCYCQNSGEAKWCRVDRPCVWERQGSIDGTTVILERSNSSVLRVTMTGLKMENSGWYWFVQGDFQMPVHISVRERPHNSKFHLFKMAK